MNKLYDFGRQAFLEGGLRWLTDDVKLVLIDTTQYSVNFAADRYLSHISPTARVATSGNFTNKTSLAGIADADDVTLVAVPEIVVSAAVIYQDTGVDSTSQLIAYLDTGIGLPLMVSGGDVTIVWSSDPALRIFKL